MRRDSWRSVPRILQAAGGEHFLLLGLALRLELGESALERLSSSNSVRSSRVRPTRCRRRRWLAAAPRPSLPLFGSASLAIASALPPSKMSVPRPAMLVEIVTAPLRPACATIEASRSCCFAFSTLYGMFFCLSMFATTSDFSTDTVPTSTGWPRLWQSSMSVRRPRGTCRASFL